jgi:NAD(P)-dependent dehydrogenase (short-subunit alcohol dehydrogenase family)
MSGYYNGFYQGKVVIVTGAAMGMGQTSAEEFAKAGAKVVVADWAEDAGRKTVEGIKAAGGTAHFVKTDVSSAASVKNMVDETIRQYGRLDVAFNNAGIMEENAPLAEIDEAMWDRIVDITRTGVFLCMKYQLPEMIKAGGGAIVNTSSVCAARILPHCAAYTASKFGVVGLTRMAAVEYGKYNIRVNAILPGAIMTPMTKAATDADPSRLERVKHTRPLGRVADPMVIAKAALWLCSDEAEHITAHSLPVDGGYVGAA